VANCPAFRRAPYFAPLYALPWDACPSFGRVPLFNLLTENIHLKIGFSSGNLSKNRRWHSYFSTFISKIKIKSAEFSEFFSPVAL